MSVEIDVIDDNNFLGLTLVSIVLKHSMNMVLQTDVSDQCQHC